FDFDPKGLGVSGLATSKPGSSGKSVARAGAGDRLAQLPADGAYYVYMNVGPESLQRVPQMGLSILAPQGGQPSPEMEKALALQREAGGQEIASETDFGDGMRQVSVITVDDPKKYREAMDAMLKATKGSQPGALNFVKDVKVDVDAETYKGFTLNR